MRAFMAGAHVRIQSSGDDLTVDVATADRARIRRDFVDRRLHDRGCLHGWSIRAKLARMIRTVANALCRLQALDLASENLDLSC